MTVVITLYMSPHFGLIHMHHSFWTRLLSIFAQNPSLISLLCCVPCHGGKQRSNVHFTFVCRTLEQTWGKGTKHSQVLDEEDNCQVAMVMY